ncbi:MAG: hypothetical protein V3W18_00425 [candidate division Zixibacteria bacterium]
MRTSVTNGQRQRGSVLVMATILSFGMFVSGLSYLGLVNKLVLETDDYVVRNQAMYAAMAGMVDEIMYAAIYAPGHNHRLKRANYFGSVYTSGNLIYGGQQQGMFGGVNVSYSSVGIGAATSHSGASYEYRVSSGHKSSTFADYLYLTDAETDMVGGGTIYFWTPDTLDGKVHTNDHISIMPWADRPVFYKRVTSSASYIYPTDNHAYFGEGLYLNMPEIYFPDQALEIRNYAAGQHTYGSYTQNEVYWILLLNGGYKINMSEDRGDTWLQDFSDLELIPIPAAGAIFVQGKCWVSTTEYPDMQYPPEAGFNGRVTIGSSDTLYIRGKTIVSCWDSFSRTIPLTCNDAIGLISERWVLVSDRIPDDHYGIEINAGIAALRGSFSVDKVYSNAKEHESLLVYGSLAQYHRGIVHRGSCGSGMGYCQKDYKYDDRFRDNPPPHFIPIDNEKPIYQENFYN